MSFSDVESGFESINAMRGIPKRVLAGLGHYAAVVLAMGLVPGMTWACACGCGLFDVGTSSMFPEHTGGMMFMEYDFMDQNKNWSGTSQASPDNNSDKRIRTDFISVGGQYQFDRSWGVMVDVPYWDRYFKTTDDSGNIVDFTHGALGDVRLRGVYWLASTRFAGGDIYSCRS